MDQRVWLPGNRWSGAATSWHMYGPHEWAKSLGNEDRSEQLQRHGLKALDQWLTLYLQMERKCFQANLGRHKNGMSDFTQMLAKQSIEINDWIAVAQTVHLHSINFVADMDSGQTVQWDNSLDVGGAKHPLLSNRFCRQQPTAGSSARLCAKRGLCVWYCSNCLCIL